MRVTLAGAGFVIVSLTAQLVAGASADDVQALNDLVIRAVAGVVILSLLGGLLLTHRRGTRLSLVGLAAHRTGSRSFVGVAAAAALGYGLFIGLAWLVGAANFDSPGWSAALGTVLTTVPLLFISTVLPEEFVFRGYLQSLLGQHFAVLTMVAAQSALYAVALSIVAGSLGGVFTAFLTGVGLGYMRLFSGGLWAVLGFRLVMTTALVLMETLEFQFTATPAVWNLVGNAIIFVFALVVANVLRPARPESILPDEGQASNSGRLECRGILYDVGTSYMPGQHSRLRWRPEVVAREMRIIREELHCNAVIVFGESPRRLEEASKLALQQGLYVWLQPRRFDAPFSEVVNSLAEVAQIAQRLHGDHPDRIGLSIGGEVSLLHRGILPGDLAWRTRWLTVVSALAPPLIGRRLNKMLNTMLEVVRRYFDGPLSYAAGSWEVVDWSKFDVVGVNYYTDVLTDSDYRGGLRRLAAHNKPVMVTEFGCCSYQGAQHKGGSGSGIMDWSNLADRRIRGRHHRDEQVQADHIEYQLDVFATEDIDGAFLCMFIEGDCHYSSDPTRDLDMASFGIVRPPAKESGLSSDDGYWTPKQAFYAVARRYRAMAAGPLR
jgi:membrane protease YdiL (CAAX protease family)